MFNLGVTEAELTAQSAAIAAEIAAINAERTATQKQIAELQAAIYAKQQAGLTVAPPAPGELPHPPPGGTIPPPNGGVVTEGSVSMDFEAIKKKIETFTGYPWYYTAGGVVGLLFLLRR